MARAVFKTVEALARGLVGSTPTRSRQLCQALSNAGKIRVLRPVAAHLVTDWSRGFGVRWRSELEGAADVRVEALRFLACQVVQ